MKYVHIVQFHTRFGGGVGSVITDLSKEMAKTSDQIYVVSLFQNEKIDFDDEIKWGKENNIKVELIQKDNMNKVSGLIRLRTFIRNLTKDDEVCLFLHLKWGVLAGVIGSVGLKRVHRVEVYHSGYMRYKLQAFFCKPFIEHYISVSKEAKTQLIKWFHINPNKINVIYNGVDINSIRKTAANVESYCIKDNNIKFISIGRLSFEKDFLTPITSYSRLRENHELNNTLYTMVGEGPQLEEAKKLSKGVILFTGKICRDEVYKNIAQSDIVILPSLWEGNSILLLEVLAIGKALVVSDIPSFREVLGFKPLNENEDFRKERFGVVFKKNNISACEKAILSISRNTKDELISMGIYSNSFVDDFSIVNQAERYFEILK